MRLYEIKNNSLHRINNMWYTDADGVFNTKPDSFEPVSLTFLPTKYLSIFLISEVHI